MKQRKKKMAVLVASLALALGLCGCALETSAENLFTLPEVPVEYTGLSNTLNTYLKSGYEYINPTGGSNMQSLQMIDLDGRRQQGGGGLFPLRVGREAPEASVFPAGGGVVHPLLHH